MRGVASDVSPSSGFRFVCYCKDCQAFARFLERADVLNPAGSAPPPGQSRRTRGPPSLAVFTRRASMRGLGRPTPFFDDWTKAPRAVPRVLTRSERATF